MSMMVLENVHSLVGGRSVCWTQALQGCDSEKHGAGGAYTFGSHYFVEVDTVLRPASGLCERPKRRVERAFVHLDYEFTHQSEHARSDDT